MKEEGNLGIPPNNLEQLIAWVRLFAEDISTRVAASEKRIAASEERIAALEEKING